MKLLRNNCINEQFGATAVNTHCSRRNVCRQAVSLALAVVTGNYSGLGTGSKSNQERSYRDQERNREQEEWE